MNVKTVTTIRSKGKPPKTEILLDGGEKVSLGTFLTMRDAEGVPFEESRAELEQVFGKIHFPAEGEGAAQGAQEAEPSLKKVSLENIFSVELAPPAFAIEQLIPSGEVSLVGAHGGMGKSVFTLTLAAHFAAGVPWNAFSPKGGRALFVSLEDPASLMQFRLKKIIEAYGLSAALVEKNLTILDGSDSGGALMVEASSFGLKAVVRTPLFDEFEKAAAGCGLIVIDGGTDAFSGDENNRRQVRSFVRELRGIAKTNLAGLILLAHIDKVGARYGAGGNSYAGSTAWHNSARCRLALLEKDGGVELVQEKLNVGKKLDRAIRLIWAEGVLMPDASSGERLDVEGQDADKVAVLSAIKKAIADGASIPVARSGPSTTQAALERFPDLPSHLRGTRGRLSFYAAITALHRAGLLCLEKYLTPSRHTRERFICAGSAALYIPPYPHAGTGALAHGSAPVQGVALITGTGANRRIGAEWIFRLPDETVCHTQPRDTTPGILL